MFTTEELMRSTTSAKLTSDADGDGPAFVTGRAEATRAGTTAETAGRANPPAKIAPTRNATTPVRTTVMRVKRRDIDTYTAMADG